MAHNLAVPRVDGTIQSLGIPLSSLSLNRDLTVTWSGSDAGYCISSAAGIAISKAFVAKPGSRCYLDSIAAACVTFMRETFR